MASFTRYLGLSVLAVGQRFLQSKPMRNFDLQATVHVEHTERKVCPLPDPEVRGTQLFLLSSNEPAHPQNILENHEDISLYVVPARVERFL